MTGSQATSDCMSSSDPMKENGLSLNGLKNIYRILSDDDPCVNEASIPVSPYVLKSPGGSTLISLWLLQGWIGGKTVE